MTAHRCLVCRIMIAAILLCVLGGARGLAQTPATTPIASPPPPTAPLTVDEAVVYALKYNPAVLNATEGVQISQTQVKIAQTNGALTAGINLNTVYTPSPASANFQGSTIPLGAALGSTLQVFASQPVYPSSRWTAPVNSAKAGVGLSSEALARTRQQVVFQTRQAFYQVLTAQELQQVAQDAVEVARRQLDLAQNTVNAGLAAPLDVFQSKAALANAEVTLVQAKNTLDVSHAVLATQLGLPAGTPVQVMAPKELPAPPTDIDALVAEALRNRPELLQYNYRRQQIRAGMELSKLELKPIVNLQPNYTQSLQGGSVFGTSGFSLSVVIAWNLINGGRTKAELKQAQQQLQQIDTSAQQEKLQVTLEVRQAWLNQQNAYQQLTAAEQQRAAAAEALRISQLRYENGEGIVLEVEQARLNLTQALTSLAQARFQALTAAAQLAFALGQTAPNIPPAPAR